MLAICATTCCQKQPPGLYVRLLRACSDHNTVCVKTMNQGYLLLALKACISELNSCISTLNSESQHKRNQNVSAFVLMVLLDVSPKAIITCTERANTFLHASLFAGCIASRDLFVMHSLAPLRQLRRVLTRVK